MQQPDRRPLKASPAPRLRRTQIQYLTTRLAIALVADTLEIRVTDSGVRFDAAHLVAPDLPASNGSLHAIDGVLAPAGIELDALASV